MLPSGAQTGNVIEHKSMLNPVPWCTVGLSSLQGLIVSKGSGSCLNQISGFEPEHDTKSIVSIIRPQNVGPLQPHFDPDM